MNYINIKAEANREWYYSHFKHLNTATNKQEANKQDSNKQEANKLRTTVRVACSSPLLQPH